MQTARAGQSLESGYREGFNDHTHRRLRAGALLPLIAANPSSQPSAVM